MGFVNGHREYKKITHYEHAQNPSSAITCLVMGTHHQKDVNALQRVQKIILGLKDFMYIDRLEKLVFSFE